MEWISLKGVPFDGIAFRVNFILVGQTPLQTHHGREYTNQYYNT
jgi:hypothetical protein